MDSANSSSLQSSSGGDEGEFDSRVDSLSAFFHSSTAGSVPGAALPPSQPPPLISSSSAAVDAAQHFFDYSYLDSSTPLFPIDSSPWPPRFHLVPGSASGSTPLAAAVYPAAGIQPSSSVQLPAEQPPAGAAPPRSSKKRSRASRRAPTTVLTTDTSNFRAMVQEFTGIPSPPFAAPAAASASPFIRSRLDLFHSAAGFRSSSAAVDAAPPSFLLRPFPQKVQSPPPFTSMFTNPTSASPPPHANVTNSGLQALLQPSLLGQNYTHPAMAATFNFNAKAAQAPPQHIPPPSAGYTDHELGGRLLQPVLIGSELRPTPGGDHSGGSSSQLKSGSSCKPNYPVPTGATELNSTYGEGGGGGGGSSGGEGRGTGGVMDSFFRLRDS